MGVAAERAKVAATVPDMKTYYLEMTSTNLRVNGESSPARLAVVQIVGDQWHLLGAARGVLATSETGVSLSVHDAPLILPEHQFTLTLPFVDQQSTLLLTRRLPAHNTLLYVCAPRRFCPLCADVGWINVVCSEATYTFAKAVACPLCEVLAKGTSISGGSVTGPPVRLLW